MQYAALCFLALAAVASAFAPAAAPLWTKSALNGVQDMAGISKPLGFFDPAGYVPLSAAAAPLPSNTHLTRLASQVLVAGL